MTTNNSKYDYYAYIVFAAKDKKWGWWMQRKLRSYRLPYSHDEKEKKKDERCFPVLHDKGILNAGAEGLRTAIEQSRYLIVICSHNALSDTVNIDEVISRFIRGGADPSSIIPFIVDSDKRPEENCFPNELQRLCEARTILGANIHDSGKHNAFLKVVARMHGLKLEQLESEDLRRKKKAEKWIAAAAVAFFAAACFIGYKAWDYYVPKTAYYADYTERYGVPEGIGELSSKEAKSSGSHYEIVSSQRKVRELRYIDGNGDLKSHESELLSERPSKITYTYSGNGELDEADWYDEGNKVLMRLDYINNKTIDVYVKRDDGVHGDGSYMQTLSSGADSLYIGKQSEDAADRAEIIRYLVDYDKKGFMAELRYSDSEVYNTAATDSNGIAGLRFERDSMGRIVKVIYLINEEPGKGAADAEAYSTFQTEYSVYGEVREYDDAFRLAKVTWVNSDGEPVKSEGDEEKAEEEAEEAESETADADETSNEETEKPKTRLKKDIYYDKEGKLNLTAEYEYGPDGPVKVTVTKKDDTTEYLIHYDEQGRPLEKFNTSFDYVSYDEIEYTDSGYISKNKYVKTVYYIDENDRWTKAEIYDSSGILDKVSVYEYDDHGREVRIESDISPTYEERHPNSKTPVLTEYEYKYDENGNVLERHDRRRYSDGSEDSSSYRDEYNDEGQIIKSDHYEGDGQLTFRIRYACEDKDDGGYIYTTTWEDLGGSSHITEFTCVKEYEPE